MNCYEIEELLPEFINGTVDKSREKEIFEHLLKCESCRKELAFWIEIADCNKVKKIEPSIHKKTKEKLIKEETSTIDLAKKAIKIYFEVIKQVI